MIKKITLSSDLLEPDFYYMNEDRLFNEELEIMKTTDDLYFVKTTNYREFYSSDVYCNETLNRIKNDFISLIIKCPALVKRNDSRGNEVYLKRHISFILTLNKHTKELFIDKEQEIREKTLIHTENEKTYNNELCHSKCTHSKIDRSKTTGKTIPLRYINKNDNDTKLIIFKLIQFNQQMIQEQCENNMFSEEKQLFISLFKEDDSALYEKIMKSSVESVYKEMICSCCNEFSNFKLENSRCRECQ